MKILVAYDGTIHAKKALSYGIRKLREGEGGELTLVQVFDRSLFVDYDAGPRAEELARAEAALRLDEARRMIDEGAAGLVVRIITGEGDASETVLRLAASGPADLILVPPRFKAIAKSAPCPVYTVPGTILAPVDNSDGVLAGLGRIVEEARATGSQVLLVGVVPVHLYSREEKKELEKVRKDTAAAMKLVKKRLAEQDVKATEAMRAGYPDEEILKAAEENEVSLIMLPSGGATPSELSKAAAILLDEPRKLRWPVFLLPAEGTA